MSGLPDALGNAGGIGFRHQPCAKGGVKGAAFCGAQAVAVEAQGRRELALAHIAASGLAGHAFWREIKSIVHHLKGHAKVFAIGGGSGHCRIVGPGGERAHFTGSADKPGRFAAHHVFIVGAARINTALGRDFENFTRRRAAGGFRETAGQARVAIIGHQGVGTGQQGIARKNDAGNIKQRMRSGLATAAYRIVQHIVVQQGRGVEHLQRDRQILYALGLMAQQAGREHGEQGPQALAARIKNVPGHRPHRFRQGVHCLVQSAVDAGQLKGQTCFQLDHMLLR